MLVVAVGGADLRPLLRDEGFQARPFLPDGSGVAHFAQVPYPLAGISLRVGNGVRVGTGAGHNALPLENHIAGGGLVQPDDGAARGGLSAAGLSHDADHLALFDGEADVIHRLEIPFPEVLLQMTDLEDGFSLCHSPSPPFLSSP